MIQSFFLELSIVMGITIIISFIMYKLKQPLLIGYILTGLLSGPLFFNILSSNSGYESFAHIGVALLLFIVGLHLNLKLIKEIGFIALVTGSLQILITSLFGFILSILFNFNIFQSMLIAISLSFSSTIVIVKILTDKKSIEKVFGKLTLGVLIVQDLVAILSLMILTTISNSKIGENIYFEIIKTFFLGFLIFAFILIFSKIILEKFLDMVAESQDLLFIFVISWCFGIAAIFSYFGFSLEIGALIAGVALASSPYQFEISSRIKPLRDFFIVMFFILLGSQMVPVSNTLIHEKIFSEGTSLLTSINILITNISHSFGYLITNFSQILIPAVILSLFVLIIKPIIIFIILNISGFHKKVNFSTGISLAQISEFSLILLLIAKTNNFITEEIVSLITLVMVITITFSTYMMTNNEKFYSISKKILTIFEVRKSLRRDAEKNLEKKHEILIFGYDRIGYSLLKTIKKLNKKFMVIDYNPSIIKKLENLKIPCIYGDANDLDFLSEFNLENVELFISTIPEIETSMLLLKDFKTRNRHATIILTANQIDNALELYKMGADYVILPHFLGGDYVSSLIENYDGNFQEFLKEKVSHISELKQRKNFGHTHSR